MLPGLFSWHLVGPRVDQVPAGVVGYDEPRQVDRSFVTAAGEG
jgi:hypothetical protein